MCRDGEADWTPDLVWFNDGAVYATPSYYVQQMFSRSLGAYVVESETDGNLFQVVTRTENELQVKAVNLSDAAVPLTVSLPGVPGQTARGELLAGEPGFVNSFARPDKIVPIETACVFADGVLETELPPYSLLVLKLDLI